MSKLKLFLTAQVVKLKNDTNVIQISLMFIKKSFRISEGSFLYVTHYES